MDTTTYPGDRHTRQTPAQRQRKLESARIHAQSALRDLAAVCDDFNANSYRLNTEEQQEWREAAEMHDAIRRALR